MVNCPYDTALVQGSWYFWRTGRKCVFLACPGCGGIVMIQIDDINEDGTIVNGFRCRRKNCSFDDQVVLVGWASRP